MKVLFLTLGALKDIESQSIYIDLLKCFRNQGHDVYAVAPLERKMGKPTALKVESGIHTLRVKTGNITSCGIIEKGISTIMLEGQYIRAIKKYLSNVKFDLVLYSTPPITFEKVVRYIKRRDGARSYLLLKDIFPQNAIDLGILKKTGIKGYIYKYFRIKEKKLYAVSDRIGCMSQANVDYLIKHNPEIDPFVIEICPNSIGIINRNVNGETRVSIRQKYGIPQDKKVFVYGGNLGRPQGIDFLIECLKSQKNKEAFFLIVGNGTEYEKLEAFVRSSIHNNVMLMKRLPKEDYDAMLTACDVGLIFLDHRFTIPNFPSRLLSYMQAGLPVLTCTDRNTDIGKTVIDGGFGWQSFSDDTVSFQNAVDAACAADLADMGERSYRYLKAHYSTEISYRIIMR